MITLPVNPETGQRMLVLRQSDFKQWLTDRRDFYFSVFENLERISHKIGVADIGTFVHAGMQAHYTNRDPLAAIAKSAMILADQDPFLTKDIMAAADFGRIIMEGYVEWLEEEALDHGLKPCLVEKRFQALVGVFQSIEVYVSGAIDLVVEDPNGLIWTIDHKTLQKFSDILPTLPNDFQGQTYDFLLRAHGIKSVGFIHNQLKRVKRTAKAIPPFYNRTVVHFNDVQRKHHLWHMQGVASDIVRGLTALDECGEDKELWSQVLHTHFQPFYTKDSSWRSDFLDVSILMDTDPEAAADMLAASYTQKEKVG